MATKTICMNDDEGSECGYTYPNSDEEQFDQGQEGQEGQEYDQEYGQEDYPEFYGNLEVMTEQETKAESKDIKKIKNKTRSLSIDSETSDITKRPNFKCGSCKKSFLLDKNQKMIRCTYCGYRILFKLRTKSYITYKTE
jgi:DNA-directed RNA polymerase subunit RPC12/RpoP